jgi:hypothetical protein
VIAPSGEPIQIMAGDQKAVVVKRVHAASEQACLPYRNGHGDGPGGAVSNWTSMSAAGSSPTTPERWRSVRPLPSRSGRH